MSKSRPLQYALLLTVLSWGWVGCVNRPVVDGPIMQEKVFWTAGEQQDRVIVFLPGLRDSYRDFVDRGLWQGLREHDLAFDAIMVDARLRYYKDRSLADRLWQDVVQPAREAGYEEVWVVGNSLGGLGALLSEKLYPGIWDGRILLAPFLGKDKELFDAFDEAGGAVNWKPTREYGKEAFAGRLWSWVVKPSTREKLATRTYLGYGESDRLRRGIGYFVTILSEDHVYPVSGSHNWKTWRVAWDRILADLESEGETRL